MNNQSPPQLPPGWIALWDESAQRYYYVEQATGTTQWEVPTAPSNAAQAGVGSRGEASSYSLPQAQNNIGYPQAGGYPQEQQQGYPQQSPGYSQQQSPGYPQQQSPGYPQQQQQGYPQGESSSYQQQSPQVGAGSSNYLQSPGYPGQPDYPNNGQPADGPDGERGMGKMLSGFGGGAITGTLIGLAAGKLLGNNNHHQQGGGFPQFGNFGAQQGYYPPPPPPQGY
ncbi:hypothetical protein INT47_006708, partial [Mucor saturninus]